MTDNTSDTPGGIETGMGEPSMEDILASIRRIIAEDEEVEETHLDIDGVVDIPAPKTEMAAPVASNDLMDTVLEITDAQDDEDVLILDQLVSESGAASDLTDIETEELVIDEAPSEDFNPVSSVVSDLKNRLAEDTPDLSDAVASDDDAILDDILADMDSENLVFTSDGNEDKGGIVTDDGFDLSSFDVDEDDMAEAANEDPMIAELTSNDEDMLSGESDLDIVKSLMADLADTSFLDDEMGEDSAADGILEELDATSLEISDEELETEVAIPAIDELDALTDELSIPTPEEEIALDEDLDLIFSDDLATESASNEDQILDDILELTIQDEEANLADLDLSVDEAVEIEVENAILADDNPLLQIAAKAEADADAMDSGKSALASAAAVATAAVAGTALADSDERVEMDLPEEDSPSTEDLLNELDLALAEVTQDDNQEEAALELEPAPVLEPELEIEPEIEIAKAAEAEVEAETAELFIEPEEPEEMPKAVRKETILDEVTETAAASAFAELNQAVEDKAVYTESGPRVGDIVQDALRPMLKEWLDENLKGIVERAVAKEVKRISSGK